MNTSLSQSILRRLTGWLMLAAYLGALPGLLPMLLGTAASASGHEVRLSAAHGDWEMVLSHHDAHEYHGTDHDGASDDDDHHHGPDHVFCFSAPASHAVMASAEFAPKVSCVAALPEKCPTPEFRIYPVPVYLDSVAARPPPGKPAWLVCLGTTVLIV